MSTNGGAREPSATADGRRNWSGQPGVSSRGLRQCLRVMPAIVVWCTLLVAPLGSTGWTGGAPTTGRVSAAGGGTVALIGTRRDSVGYSPVVYWLRSDRIGTYGNVGRGAIPDCAIAAAADLEQIFQRSASPLPARPWVEAYFELLGSVDGNRFGAGPAGLDVSEVLGTWQREGIAGTRIASAIATPLAKSALEAELASGPLYAELDLPRLAWAGSVTYVDGRSIAVQPWSLVAPGSGYSSGGLHAVVVVGFDASYVYVETWGYVQPVTWGWWAHYAVAAWRVTP